MTFPCRHISIAINRPAQDVYAFTSNPENLPQWASGLSGTIKHVDEKWIAESPMGSIQIEFAEKNPFGVLDHDVTLPSGDVFDNPMRVVPNGDGSEVAFTLYRRPEMTEQAFEEDAATILKDLKTLKGLLER